MAGSAEQRKGGKKGRKYGRHDRKPSGRVYTTSNRRDVNKKRRIEKSYSSMMESRARKGTPASGKSSVHNFAPGWDYTSYGWVRV